MRKLKSIAVCALCLCLLLSLAGCAAAQRPLCVTLVLKTETDVAEFWGMLLSGVRKAAEEYGVDLTVRTSPTETAIDEQIELIRQTAAEKPDVMILSAADYDRCAEATEEAIAAGIGVIFWIAGYSALDRILNFLGAKTAESMATNTHSGSCSGFRLRSSARA